MGERSKVYMTDLRCRPGVSLLNKLEKLMRTAGIGEINFERKLVAIKMHFGEPGNLAFLRPNYAKVVADVVKSLGGVPFLTDCNTLYPGRRKNALADEEGRMAFLREAVETVAALQSPIEREIYGNKAAAAAGISSSAFAQEVERFRKNRAWQARKKQARRELTPAAQLQPRERELRYENLRSARAEEGVVRLLLLEPDLFPQVEGLGPEQFSAPVLAKIYALLCQRHREGRSTQLAALAGALSPEEMSHLVSVMDQPEALAHSAQALRDYIEIIETEALKRGGAGASDPLLAAREKFRERKAYGG